MHAKKAWAPYALQTCVDQLLSGGTKILAVACNTFHLFLDGITTGDGCLVKINQATMHVAQRQDLRRLLILGTPLTLHHKLYQHHAITCITPPEENRSVIENIINRILAGRILAEDSEILSSMINHLHDKIFFDGIVLGCTELPVLHKQHPLRLATKKEIIVLDTLKCLAQCIVTEARR